MSGYRTTEIDGSFSLEDINARVSETEENWGPLLSIATREDGTNIASFRRLSPDDPRPEGDQLTALTLAATPEPIPGRVIVFFGSINVASRLTSVLAHRKA